MLVDVKLFATLQKDRFQRRYVELPEGVRISSLLAKLGISPDEVGILVVNQRDATLDQEITDGDTITMIPPIGGG